MDDPDATTIMDDPSWTPDSILVGNVMIPIEKPMNIEPVSAIVAPIIFATVFVVGVIGNGLQVFTVLSQKAMRRSPPNVLIACLGFADLALLIICVPFASIVYVISQWPLGGVICRLTKGGQTLSVAASVLTLTALSADRYVAIVHPLAATVRHPTSLRRIFFIVAAVWTTSAAFAAVDFYAADVRPWCGGAPLGVCNSTLDAEVDSLLVCHEHPPEWGNWYPAARATMRLVVLFIIPLTAIAIFYGSIAWVLFGGAPKEITGEFRQNPGGRQQLPAGVMTTVEKQERERNRVAKVVLAFIVVFIICWLPRHVYLMLFYFVDFEFNEHWHAFKVTGFCLTFVYSCINPLALYWLSDEFRRHFDHYLFGCCCPSRRLRVRRDTTTTTFDPTRKRTSTSIVASTPNISLENLAR